MHAIIAHHYCTGWKDKKEGRTGRIKRKEHEGRTKKEGVVSAWLGAQAAPITTCPFSLLFAMQGC
jgi:hypothetical protein